MDITVNIRLANSKEPNYTFNIDLDSEGRFNKMDYPTGNAKPDKKTELGGVQRPDADRLKIIKNPTLRAEDEATAAVMDKLEME